MIFLKTFGGKIKMRRNYLFILMLVVATSISFAKTKLLVFHAGSLTVPFMKIEKAFETKYPDIDIQRVIGGSRKLARMIVDAGSYTDIFASADYTLIDEMLSPKFSYKSYKFASNEMVICYTPKSKFATKINPANWYEILQSKDVNWGQASPDIDPCGYRTIISIKLAEKYYKLPGLYKKITANRPLKNIRPKSVELISLLKSGFLDYAWEYKSVAIQHGLKFVELPNEINLSNLKYNDFYKTVNVKLSGKKPGTYVFKKGKAIIYGITMIKKTKYFKNAKLFLDFVLNENLGGKILRESGQNYIYKSGSKAVK